MSAPVDELELVRAFFGEPPEADPLAMARARRGLQGHVRARARRRRWPAAVAVALVVLVAGIVWLPSGAPSEAQRALHRFAVVATDLDLAAGNQSVVYERFEVNRVDTRTALELDAVYQLNVRSAREVWRAPDGSLSARERVISVEFVSEADRDTWEAIGQPPLPQSGDVSHLSADDLPLPDLGGLPGNPNALLGAVRKRSHPDQLGTNQQLLRAIGELLARGDAGPELRADLFRAAATIPGIELLGPVRDPLDREGIGLSLGPLDDRVTLVLDEATSVLLSVSEDRVVEGVSASAWNAYSIWATVPEIGDRPVQAEIV